MPKIIPNGKAGDKYTNDTGKVLYQFFCSLSNTCGACLQYHHAIGTWFPIPIHYGCRCYQTVLAPGAAAEPWVDFRDLLSNLPPDQKAAAIGASNYKLLQSGVVKWEDVVSQSRVRTLAEVVSIHKITVGQMTKSGVKPAIAATAYSTVNTPAHQLAAKQRQQLVNNLLSAGLSGGQIQQAFGQQIADKITLAGGPTWKPTVVGKPKTSGSVSISFPQLIAGLALNDKAVAALQPAKPEDLPNVGPSKAEITPTKDQDAAIQQAESILGKPVSAQDLASLAGAPGGTEVSLYKFGGKVTVVFESGAIGKGVRNLFADGGNAVLQNQWLGIKDAGQGLGTQVLAMQIENATKLGVSKIILKAAGDPSQNEIVGYKVWPKFGFDGPLPKETVAKLPPEFKGAKKVSDLYKTPAGVAWWEANGQDVDLSFDLSAGSYSQRVWTAYRAGKDKDKDKQSGR